MKRPLLFVPLVLFLLLTSFIFLATATSSRVNALQDKTKSGNGSFTNNTTYKAAIIDNYAPYAFVNTKGQPDGFSVDLMRTVTRVMGINLETKVDTWENARLALENGGVTLDLFLQVLRVVILIFSLLGSLLLLWSFSLKKQVTARTKSLEMEAQVRLLAEQAARKEHDQLAATLDALPDLLFEVGLDGLVYDFHSPRTELLYRSVVDTIGKKVHDILPANIAEVVMSAIKDAHEKGSSSGKQFELKVPKGTLWFEISVSRKASAPDDPHFIVLSRDISERKHVEDALRESQNRYQLVFENSGTANAIFDTECRLILQNSLSIQNLGTIPGAALGKTALELFGNEQGRIVTERMRRVLTSGVKESFETEFDLLTGIKWFRSIYQPIFDDQKVLIGVQVISQDITEHKKVEKDLRDSESQLRRCWSTCREACDRAGPPRTISRALAPPALLLAHGLRASARRQVSVGLSSVEQCDGCYG